VRRLLRATTLAPTSSTRGSGRGIFRGAITRQRARVLNMTSNPGSEDALQAITDRLEQLTARFEAAEVSRAGELSELTSKLERANTVESTQPSRSARSKGRSRRTHHSSVSSSETETEKQPPTLAQGTLQEPVESMTPDRNTSLLEPGLSPLHVSDERLVTLLDYRSYRLRNMDFKVSSRASGRVSEYANRVRSQTPVRFSGNPAIGILRFLRTLRIAFDDTGLSEGVALRVIPHFLDEPVATSFQRALRIHGGSLSTYAAAVSWFIATYAPESVVTSKLREISLLNRDGGESVNTFATRLQAEASLLGDLISERSLCTYFYAGLDTATATFSQSLLPHGALTQTFHEAVAHATKVDQSVSSLRPTRLSTTQLRSDHPQRAPLARARGILSVHDGDREEFETEVLEGNLDVEHGALVVNEDQRQGTKLLYCFVCWKQGHYANSCPLIPERVRNEIAGRKAAALALMRLRPGLQDRSGRIVPNTPLVQAPETNPSDSTDQKNGTRGLPK
jgi:hypothetical protein